MFNLLSKLLRLDINYFAKGGFWIGLNLIITTTTGLILSSVFARVWPSDVYGQYSFFLSFLTFISLTSLPGFITVVSQAATEGSHGVYKEAVRLILKWSLLGTAAIIAMGGYFLFRNNSNLGLVFILTSLAFPLNALGSIFGTYLTGRNEFKKASIFAISAQLFSNILTILALLYVPSLIAVAIISTWSLALANLFFTAITLKSLPNNKIDKKLLKLGIHLSTSQILIIIADNIDKFLIPLLLGFTSNAIYAFAILIPNQIQNIFKSFLTLGQPKIAIIKNKYLTKNLFYKSFIMEFLVLIVVITYLVISPFLFKIFYPNYLDNTLKFSQLFSLGLLFYPSNLFGYYFINKRDSKVFYKINVIYLFSSSITCLVLIPIWGITGAIVAKILVKFIYGAMQLYLFKKNIS